VAQGPPSPDIQRQLLLATSFPIIAVSLLNGLWLDALYRTSPLAFWAADVSHFVILPLIGVAVLGVFAGIWPRQYGFHSFERDLSPLAIVGLLAFITFLYWLCYSPVRDLAYRSLWQSAGYSYELMLPKWPPYRLLTTVYMSVSAGFVEEAVFRSLPWLYFSMRFPNRRFVGLYVFTTSIVFAAIHWEQGPHGVIAAFSVGVMAAVMYSKLRNIWPFVFAHFATDVAAF
jgi:hypothetical protein